MINVFKSLTGVFVPKAMRLDFTLKNSLLMASMFALIQQELLPKTLDRERVFISLGNHFNSGS